MSEFNLSEKREAVLHLIKGKAKIARYNYSEKNVKEFIKKDGDIIREFIEGKISCAGMWLKRVELVGDKLIFKI